MNRHARTHNLLTGTKYNYNVLERGRGKIAQARAGVGDETEETQDGARIDEELTRLTQLRQEDRRTGAAKIMRQQGSERDSTVR